MAGIAPSAARGGPRAWCGARAGRSRRSCGDWERRRAADRQAGLRCWPAGDEQDGDRSVVDQAVGHAADEPRSARGRCRGGRRRSPPLRALRPRFTAPQTPATESAAATTASASKPARTAASTPSAERRARRPIPRADQVADSSAPSCPPGRVEGGSRGWPTRRPDGSRVADRPQRSATCSASDSRPGVVRASGRRSAVVGGGHHRPRCGRRRARWGAGRRHDGARASGFRRDRCRARGHRGRDGAHGCA